MRAGRWAAAPCAVVRAGERRRRGRRRCPRRGPSGPRAVRRGTGRGTLDGAREPGQTGDGAATHFTASTKSKFERPARQKNFARNDLLREEAVHRLIGCLRTVWGRHSPTMPLGHRAGRWESRPWRLARKTVLFIHSFTSSSSCERSAVARDYVTSRAVHRRYFTFARSWCTAPLNGATVPNRGFSRLTCE